MLESQTIPYELYLLTPDWRRRRDRALVRASWRCERCNSARDLQVHHRTYARLGAELDSDLEVLCGPCHKSHHIQERESSGKGIYLKIVREALKLDPYGSTADVTELAKCLCASHHVPYSGPDIYDAVGLLTHARVVQVSVATLTRPPYADIDAAAVNAEIAHEILTGLGLPVVGDVMKMLPDGVLPHKTSVLEQARMIRQEMRMRGEATSRTETFGDRLERIFAPEPSRHDETEEGIQRRREREEINHYIRWYGGNPQESTD